VEVNWLIKKQRHSVDLFWIIGSLHILGSIPVSFCILVWYMANHGNLVYAHTQSTMSDLASLKLTPEELVSECIEYCLLQISMSYLCLILEVLGWQVFVFKCSLDTILTIENRILISGHHIHGHCYMQKCHQFDEEEKWWILWKTGSYCVEEYATLQLHHSSCMEVNKFPVRNSV